MTFRTKLSRLLADRNRREVARRAELNPMSLANYVNRGTKPFAGSAMQLARALSVDFQWLMDDSQGWPPVWVNYSDPPKRKREPEAA